MMRVLALAGVLAFAVIGVAHAACDGATTLFADNFDKLEPTWGEASDVIKVDSGRLVVTAAADSYFWAANTASVYDDIAFCADVITVTGIVPEDAKAGLVFWYVDVNNFYVFEIAPNGKASVWRRQRGRWLAQVNWQDASGANQGDGATNALEVNTAGSEATFFVNGTKFKDLTGSPPDNGQEIGVFAASPSKGVATFAFDNLKITKP